MKKGDYMLFLTSIPWGKLRLVEILGKNPKIKDGIYIRYLTNRGGTDTTKKEFLFDIPDNVKIQEDKGEII